MYFTVSSECGGSKPDAVYDSTESGTRCESSIVNADVIHPLSTHQQCVRPSRRFGHVASDREVLGQSSVSDTS